MIQADHCRNRTPIGMGEKDASLGLVHKIRNEKPKSFESIRITRTSYNSEHGNSNRTAVYTSGCETNPIRATATIGSNAGFRTQCAISLNEIRNPIQTTTILRMEVVDID